MDYLQRLKAAAFFAQSRDSDEVSLNFDELGILGHLKPLQIHGVSWLMRRYLCGVNVILGDEVRLCTVTSVDADWQNWVEAVPVTVVEFAIVNDFAPPRYLNLTAQTLLLGPKLCLCWGVKLPDSSAVLSTFPYYGVQVDKVFAVLSNIERFQFLLRIQSS